MCVDEQEDPRDAIILELNGDALRCVLSDDVPATKDVEWTLHRGDYDPRRASKPFVGGRRWRTQLPDMTSGYSVRARVDNVTYESRWVQHYSTESVAKYRAWRSGLTADSVGQPQQIPLFRYEYPFDNIAFICHSAAEGFPRLAMMTEANGLVAEDHSGIHWPYLTVISGRGSQIDDNGTRYVFSGVTRDQERLLFGPEDVDAYSSDVNELRDGIGEFHLLSWTPDEIFFGHDYIGQGHLFYYEGDGILVAANGLHLLALILRTIGVRLSLDPDAAKVKFFSTSYPFETEQSTSTDFMGVRRVSVYEELRVSRLGPNTHKSQLWHDGLDGEFSEALYEQELEQARLDILDNIRVALAHPRFKNVIVELSAGLDTRIIYSALTNLPASEKVRIATRAGSEERTAAAINNLYGYRWDDLAKTHQYPMGDGDEDLPLTSHSVFMDGYYIESMFKLRSNYAEPTLILTGHGGEAFSRVMSIEGFYARNFSGEIEPSPKTMGDVLRNVVRYIGNHQVWLETGETRFPHTLRASLAESPSNIFEKKFSDLYTSQRNPFVGGSVFRGAMSAPQWRPLQSKALYRLKSRWFQHHQDFRLQFDLIRGLNPLVSEVPYLKEVEMARKAEAARYRPSFPIKNSIDFDDSIASVSESRKVAAQRAVWKPTKEAVTATKGRIQEYEDSASSFLDPLAYILTNAPEFEEMGLPVFTYIDRMTNRSNPRAFSKRHNIRNKLHILMQEIMLTR